LKRFAPTVLVVAVVAAILLWPRSKTSSPPRPVETATPPSGTPASDSDSWTRFAEATARRMGTSSDSGTRIRSMLAQESFELEAKDVPEALQLLAKDLDPESMFRLTKELSRLMTPDQVRLAAAILREAPRRDVGLHSLLGRTEVREEVIEFFLKDPEVSVRATAAFLLQEIPEGLPSEVMEAARDHVQHAPDSLKIESMELLAAAGFQGDDARLVAAVGQASTAEVKNAAARALAAGKADSALLRPVLESLASDSSAPPEAREAAKEALKSLP